GGNAGGFFPIALFLNIFFLGFCGEKGGKGLKRGTRGAPRQGGGGLFFSYGPERDLR
ncbi:LOW QUALITY PROTEIN: PE-PGRS family protein, partial [Mycobacterium tuberculosis EAS054]